MLFENKTNSKILANLQVPKNILNKMYMTNPGWGLDILEALHTIISPEELVLRQMELNISDKQIKRLFKWLKVNCHMNDYRNLILVEEEMSLGYHFAMMSIIDNNQWGLLTKIRRNLINYDIQINTNGEISYEEIKWVKAPELIFENEDSRLYVRNPVRVAGNRYSRQQNPKLASYYCYAKEKDYFYENISICFQKINGQWQKATEEHKQNILNAIEVIKLMAV
ncbi:MAG: hypothetical protein K0R18_297 [Bacillales bacterium]|jgi:hypothetical protein|nr:hypothetical protein [Bacillales bacterium]